MCPTSIRDKLWLLVNIKDCIGIKYLDHVVNFILCWQNFTTYFSDRNDIIFDFAMDYLMDSIDS